MKTLTKATIAALLGIGSLALMAGSASAAVVCNSDGDCWHTHDAYAYPSNVGVVVHDDSWRWDADHANAQRDADHAAAVRYRWREHEGRGYWQNNTWVTF